MFVHSHSSSIHSLATQKDIVSTQTLVIPSVESVSACSVPSDSSSISSYSTKEGIGSTKSHVLCSDMIHYNEVSFKEQIHADYNALFSDWESKITFPAYFNYVFEPQCNILHFVGDLQYRNQLQSVRICH